jgi:hypothetical protein
MYSKAYVIVHMETTRTGWRDVTFGLAGSWKEGSGPMSRWSCPSSAYENFIGCYDIRTGFSLLSRGLNVPWKFFLDEDVVECRHLYHLAQTLFYRRVARLLAQQNLGNDPVDEGGEAHREGDGGHPGGD